MDRCRVKIEVVSDEMAEILRAKSPMQRLAIANNIYHFVRRLLLNSLTQQHPEWNERELTMEVARRISHGSV